MFKDELKRLRKEKKWTQEKLAKLLGVAKSTISMYENGNRTPDLETFEKMTFLFNISLDNLIYGDDVEYIERKSTEEQKLLDLYRNLNYEGQEEILKYLKYIISDVKYKKNCTDSMVSSA